MKTYKILKALSLTFIVVTMITLILVILFFNVNDLSFVRTLIEQCGQSVTGESFTITSDIIFECQRWSLVVGVIFYVLSFIFVCATFSKSEKLIKSIKYSQRIVTQTYTNTVKDKKKLYKAQLKERKMKLKEKKAAAKLAKQEAKLKAKEEAKAEKLAKKEAKEETKLAKQETKTTTTAATPEATVAKTEHKIISKKQRINDILNELK